MKKALVYASVASMIQQFNRDNIRLLMEDGYHVDIACNLEKGSNITEEKIALMKAQLTEMGVGIYHVSVPRKIFALGEIFSAYRTTKKILDENNYSLIHCHSPIGGMICRLANRFSKHYKTCKMIYTAHGFHFFKGAPLANWVFFSPVERICSRFTDILITINQEDFALAKKFRLKKGGQVKYVPGIGVDLEKTNKAPENREALLESLSLSKDSVLLLSVGELNGNKNHKTVLETLPSLPKNYHYLICGQGEGGQGLAQRAKELGCGDRLHILGFRDDVLSILKASDLFLFPSHREGLSVALMEAMAAGKAVVASKIRGNTDLIDSNGGILFDPKSVADCQKAIEEIFRWDLAAKGAYNKEKIKAFSKEKVSALMTEIYRQVQ